MGALCRLLVVGLVTIHALRGSPLVAQETWRTLLQHVPTDANAVVAMHVDKLRDSPFFKRADAETNQATLSGLRSILPRGEIQRALLASHLNLLDLSSDWDVGVLETTADRSWEQFSFGIRGPRETLGTHAAVRLPFSSYLLQVAPRTFAMYGPADRQKATRWAQRTASPAVMESAYLNAMLNAPEFRASEILVGIDLADSFDIALASKVLAESPVIRSAAIDANSAAPILVSIEGVSLEIRLLEQATGKLRVQFARDPKPLANVLKPFLLERLAARGAMIPEFAHWTFDLQGPTASLTGALTPLGLSRVLSIVEPEFPAATASQAASNTAAAPNPTPPAQGSSPAKAANVTTVIQNSKQHFSKLKALVTEVRFPSSDLKVNSASAFGVWIERQARRIDQLPMLDVDPELLDCSQGTAQSLRTSAAKLRGANIRASVYSNNNYRYRDAGSDLGGYYDGYSTTSPKAIQTRMETASANLSHVEIMRMVDDELAAIRRVLTERYRVEF